MANLIPREILREIQERTSIVSVVSRYATLRKQGRGYVGLCPFHSEKTPSFHVDETKGLFYCFGCQVGGDVFKFIMGLENQSFPEVVRDLAVEAGVQIPEPDLSPEQRQRSRRREALFDINEMAARYFESCLDGPLGVEAIAYLKARGMTSAIAEKFRFGYAPSGWQGFVDSLNGKHSLILAAMEAGLILEGRSNGKPYDRFRNRVMFPITDARGRVIAFGGRALGDDNPKYLNSPESPLFVKSNALFALSEARRSIGQKDMVLVVEGYFDVLNLFLHGVENVVATCGTSLTRGHLKLLRRYTRKVALLYDGDRAGQQAAERSLDLFLDEDMWPYYVSLSGGQDPDDFIREVGVDGFNERTTEMKGVYQRPGAYSALNGAEVRERLAACWPLLDHIVMERCREAIKSADGQEMLIAELGPVLSRIPPLKLGHYLNLISEHTGLRPDLIEAQLERVRRDPQPRRENGAKPMLRLDLPAAEERFVQMLCGQGDVIAKLADEWGVLSQMTHTGLKAFATSAVESLMGDDALDVADLLDQVEDDALRQRLSRAIFQNAGSEGPDEDKNWKGDAERIFLKIRQHNLSIQLKELQEKIARLSRSAGDPGVLGELVQHRLQLVRENEEIKRRLARRAA